LGKTDGNDLIGGDIESGGTFGTTGTGVRTGRGLVLIDGLFLIDCLFLLLVLLLVAFCGVCFGVSIIVSVGSKSLTDFLTALFGVVTCFEDSVFSSFTFSVYK
jgi:hypothetical protein